MKNSKTYNFVVKHLKSNSGSEYIEKVILILIALVVGSIMIGMMVNAYSGGAISNFVKQSVGIISKTPQEPNGEGEGQPGGNVSGNDSTYTINFLKANGDLISTGTLPEGEPIIFPTPPESDTETFVSWVDENSNVITQGYSMPASNLDIFAVYKPTVMLIPKAGSTTIINRQGLKTKNYTAEIKNWLIYGLEVDIRGEATLLNEYLDIQGNGHIEIVPVTNQSYGTGTVVNVYDDDTTELVESFHIVIFGDVNGDGRTTSADTTIVEDEVDGRTSWSLPTSSTYSPWKALAADLQWDNRETEGIIITNEDENAFRAVVLGFIYDLINQGNGTIPLE